MVCGLMVFLISCHKILEASKEMLKKETHLQPYLHEVNCLKECRDRRGKFAVKKRGSNHKNHIQEGKWEDNEKNEILVYGNQIFKMEEMKAD